jgi:hypothetical protein
MEAKIYHLPPPKELTPEQRLHWQERAADWEIQAEDSLRAYEYACRQRESALRMLGMIAVERGLEG